ncbi:MAG TPA: hypothetical protein VKU01_34205 [Bryobacteraceae bacterium]|nr:hypothetical protein [Bryobacteraceae bacterium]
MPSKTAATSSLIVAALCILAVPSANAQQLQSFKDCVVGKRVSTNDGRKGTITRLDRAWSYCYVRFDDDSKEASFLYSLLNAEDGSAKRDDLQVRQGVYECVTGTHYTTMEMRVTGTNTYSAPGGSGKFHIEPSGKIVFETGPLTKFSSKLLSGGRIGLNTDGGNFYGTSCEFNGTKH